MKLKKCPICKAYTLKQEHCKKPAKEAHYKFIDKFIKRNSEEDK